MAQFQEKHFTTTESEISRYLRDIYLKYLLLLISPIL